MPLPPGHVRRHFLAWDRPWLEQATAWLAREWQGAGPLDLSGVLAIVPTQQAGRRLREALAGLAAERNSAVFAPRVLTPEALLRQGLGSAVASPLQSLLAWADVFLALELEQFREVFPVDPPARSFPWALRLGQQFNRLQVTLGEAGLRLEDVAEKAGENFVERARWEQIAELSRLHTDRLAGRQLREPQAARIESATRNSFEAQFKRIVVLAVPDLAPLVTTRLACAAASVPVDLVVFAPASEAAGFDAWGAPVPADWEQRVVEFADFEQRVHLCADPAMQAARLAGLAGAHDPADGMLAVGIADPDVAPLVENELRRKAIAVFNPDGTLMRRGGLYALLSILAELMRDPAFAVVESLARCPDFIAYLQRKHDGRFSAVRWLRDLDDLKSEHLPVDLAAGRRFAAEDGWTDELRHGLEAMSGLRDVLQDEAFAAGGARVLREIFSARQIDRTREEDLRFESAASAWVEMLRQCVEAGEKFPDLTVSDWWELALHQYGEQRIAEEKPTRALELQGWLELLWEDAPHLVIAGMNDGRVPEAVVEDAFLPGPLRQRLGLTSNAARLARDTYIAQAIAACRQTSGRLDLLLGKTAASGDPLRPSRLLLRCPDSLLPKRIAFLFRPVELNEANASWTRAWKLKPRVAAPPTRVAVTALRRYLSCPFRFYLRHVLRMESVDPGKSELDAFDFGTLCHFALEKIGSSPALQHCTDARVIAEELLRQLDRRVEERYGKLLSLPLLVQVESARQRLARFAELQAAERAAGWEIIHVERPFEIEIAGLRVRGKIDRIDRQVETGAVRILDYKTSDASITPPEAHLRAIRPGEELPAWARVEVDGKTRAWADLQLPLYRRALAAEFPGSVTCGYFNLPKAAGDTLLTLWDEYTPAIHDSAMACAEGACAAIARGEFWPPNELIPAERDECAALFHHGAESSVEWTAR
jgi:ATP-dependent helicase/nuclease subunit B